MLDSVSLRHEMQISSIHQSLIACDGYTDHEFLMDRSQGTNERDWGRLVGCLDERHDHNNPDNLRCVSL
jgi:hypothetical protein